MDIEKILDGLNPSQKKAVETTEGPVMLLAGAGSGKTRTIVNRIQYLIEHQRVSPYQILAVTFSNKAAREMRERVSVNSKIDMGVLQITTFHSFCARLLRKEASYLGLSKNFTIYDDSESRTIIKSLLGKRGISQKEISPYEVMYYIENLKNLGWYNGVPEHPDFEFIEEKDLFHQLFLEYEVELHKSNALDFGGLITAVLQLFEKFPDVREQYQKRYRYLLVDEYQDTNRAQFDLVCILSDQHKNICVVGDEDQSIYSWRGADIRNILDFEEIFPEYQLIKLEQNYRSSKTIIEAATSVISNNDMRKGKEMWTDNPDGESIQIVECSSDRDEAEFLVTEVKQLMNDGVDGEDIAVFYRNNSQSRMIEDGLRRAKINYRIVGGIKFYERKEIKDLLAYARVVVNRKDSLALSRIINVPTRGIGATTLKKLEDVAVNLRCSLFEAIEDVLANLDNYKSLRLSAKVRTGLSHLVDLINEVGVIEEELLAKTSAYTPSFCFEKLLEESGYLTMLKAEKSYESQARIENLEELLSGVVQFERDFPHAAMMDYLETVTLNANREEDTGSEVSLMTVHSSKGLEYPYVFVMGTEETLFPSFKSLESGDQAIEEERRLFYVAMTRAMKRLYICFAQTRMLWGSLKYNGPSRFIHEIPDKYFLWYQFGKEDDTSSESTAQYSGGIEYDYGDQFDQSNHFSKPVESYRSELEEKALFERGAKVNHQVYGDGVVIESDGFGEKEKVLIRFNEGSVKRFMVKMAPLSHI